MNAAITITRYFFLTVFVTAFDWVSGLSFFDWKWWLVVLPAILYASIHRPN